MSTKIVHIFDMAMEQKAFLDGIPVLAATTLSDILNNLPLNPRFSQASILQASMYRQLAEASPALFLVEDHIPQQCRAAILFPSAKRRVSLYVALGQLVDEKQYSVNRKGPYTRVSRPTGQGSFFEIEEMIQITEGAFFVIIDWPSGGEELGAHFVWGTLDRSKRIVRAEREINLGTSPILRSATTAPRVIYEMPPIVNTEPIVQVIEPDEEAE